ncbi:MAG: 2,3-diphosphoglycerate-dependent phosphoglycerate mutase [Gammaproteobacteria bacterium]|nr:2,3-diphosphoglycerate-dependent phosphoglycerate mutase [Gammaproteobacteria bacterium]
MVQVVLIRHGQSVWNLENRFTGWVDVDLSERGMQEARAAGKGLRDAGYRFDIAFTSLLKRSIRTLWLTMEQLDQMWLPVINDWRLNERHYGALQGLNKRDMTEKHGAEQVHQWRRGYAVRPPALAENDPMHPKNDPRYTGINQLPSTESLADTVQRVVPFWNDTIVPALKQDRHPLIIAHGNSIRALVKHLDGIDDDAIAELNIPTGQPLIYELDQNFNPVNHFYLADPEEIAAAVKEVSEQSSPTRKH